MNAGQIMYLLGKLGSLVGGGANAGLGVLAGGGAIIGAGTALAGNKVAKKIKKNKEKEAK